MRKAVFFDRDGTLMRLVYNAEADAIDTASRKEEVELAPSIGTVLRKLQKLGYILILVSNQPRIGLRKQTKQSFSEVQKEFARQLRDKQVEFAREYYCFHHPFASLPSLRQRCRCRKPGVAFFHRARQEFDIDLRQSWVVGDGVNDIIAGHRIGAKTILIANLMESAYLSLIRGRLRNVKPNYVVKAPREILKIITT